MKSSHEIAAVCLAVLLLGAAGGCGPEETPEAVMETAGPADATYETRGKIVELPATAAEARGPSGALRIRHEAVPEFTTDQGEITGMTSMTMPFPLAPGLDVEGLAEGDVIAFSFEVRWDGSPPYQIVRLEKLPAETELDFGIPGEIDAPVPDGEPPVDMPAPPRP
jgi:hypothetical protein